MTRQINLLNPALIHKRDFLNPNTIVMLFGVLFVGLIAYTVYERNALSALQIKRTEAANALASTQSRLTEVMARKTVSNDKTAILNQIKQLEEKETMQKAMINAIAQTSDTKKPSYAALLRAFAKQSIDGLWITGLSINQDAEQLRISGRTLNADLVPKYIAKLRAEPALKGKTFSELTMLMNEAAEPAKVEAIANNVTANIANKDTKISIQPANPQVVNAQVVNESPIQNYIEFTLQSKPEVELKQSGQSTSTDQNLAGVTN
jgi:Tfp pilus assembly protein PilN